MVPKASFGTIAKSKCFRLAPPYWAMGMPCKNGKIDINEWGVWPNLKLEVRLTSILNIQSSIEGAWSQSISELKCLLCCWKLFYIFSGFLSFFTMYVGIAKVVDAFFVMYGGTSTSIKRWCLSFCDTLKNGKHTKKQGVCKMHTAIYIV